MARASYEWLIGTRYLRSAHRRGFVSFVSAISVRGMLGVAVLIVVLSVMNGFERELRTRILSSVTSHATLTGLEGRCPTGAPRARWRCARPASRAGVPYVEAQAMLAAAGEASGPARELARHRPGRGGQGGRLAQRHHGRLDGRSGPARWRHPRRALATDLGVVVGDSVVLIAPEGARRPTACAAHASLHAWPAPSSSGMYEFDRRLALVDIADAARLLPPRRPRHGPAPRAADPYQRARAVRDLALALGGGFYVERLDAQPRQLLPLDRADQVADVRDPADDRRRSRRSTSSRRW
jgi:lipoprotein-releasing system permease protein